MEDSQFCRSCGTKRVSPLDADVSRLATLGTELRAASAAVRIQRMLVGFVHRRVPMQAALHRCKQGTTMVSCLRFQRFLKRRRMRKKVISAYFEARSVEKNMGATKIQLMWRRKMQENEKIRSRMGKSAQLKQLLGGKANAKNMQYQHIIIIQVNNYYLINNI